MPNLEARRNIPKDTRSRPVLRARKQRTQSKSRKQKTNKERRNHSELQTATRKESQQHHAKHSRPRRASTTHHEQGGTETSKGRTQTTNNPFLSHTETHTHRKTPQTNFTQKPPLQLQPPRGTPNKVSQVHLANKNYTNYFYIKT